MSTPTATPPVTSLVLIPLYGTWLHMNGTGMKPGKATVSVPARLTSTTDEKIIPGGVWWEGPLSTEPGTRSLGIEVPATDDPAIRETGWWVNVRISFDGGGYESYTVEVPRDALYWSPPGVNLRDQTPKERVPDQHALLRLGQPGGLALFEPDGSIVNPITGENIIGGDGTGADMTDLAAAYESALGNPTQTSTTSPTDTTGSFDDLAAGYSDGLNNG